MLTAIAQLTDKMDPKYIIALELAGSHDDAHVKKNLAILDFWENGKNVVFCSCFSVSRPPRRQIFGEGDPLIKNWELKKEDNL